MARRARAHKERQEALRKQKEEELLGMEAKLKDEKVEEYRHRYMRDARENWDRHKDRLKPFMKDDSKKKKSGMV